MVNIAKMYEDATENNNPLSFTDVSESVVEAGVADQELSVETTCPTVTVVVANGP